MHTGLDGKRVIVTGGGSGIGRAAAILFLASDAASNISGTILPVDNGWSAV